MRVSRITAAMGCLAMCALCGASLKSLDAHAQAGIGQSAPITRIADVLWKPVADQRVALRGRIIRDNGANKYMFADESGEMTVVISSALLGGKEVSEYASVSLEGRVIIDYRSTPEILVERIQIGS